jgi:hypothetical protein
VRFVAMPGRSRERLGQNGVWSSGESGGPLARRLGRWPTGRVLIGAATNARWSELSKRAIAAPGTCIDRVALT